MCAYLFVYVAVWEHMAIQYSPQWPWGVHEFLFRALRREDWTVVFCSKGRRRQVPLCRLVAPVDPAEQATNHTKRHGLRVQRGGKTAPVDRYGSFFVIFLSEPVPIRSRTTWIVYELPRDDSCILKDHVYIETRCAKRVDQVVQDVARRQSNEMQVCRIGDPVAN